MIGNEENVKYSVDGKHQAFTKSILMLRTEIPWKTDFASNNP